MKCNHLVSLNLRKMQRKFKIYKNVKCEEKKVYKIGTRLIDKRSIAKFDKFVHNHNI